MARRPEWTHLVTARGLIEHLDDPGLVILDGRHVLTDADAGPRMYADGHIPGALHADCDRDLAGAVTAATGRHPMPEPQKFRSTASGWGIGPETQVVVYDDAGGAWAARAWWLLRHYGHASVALLDGGIQSYLEEGGTLTDEIPSPEPEDFVGAPGHMPTVGFTSLVARLPAPPGSLIDARDPPRYRAEAEPIDRVAGHIPGAANLPHRSLVDGSGHLKPRDELARSFRDVTHGRTGDEVAVYCGSGVTSALLVLAMEHAGLGTPALYAGSWSEWIRDPSRPIARAGS